VCLSTAWWQVSRTTTLAGIEQGCVVLRQHSPDRAVPRRTQRAELHNRELFEALARDHANFTYVPTLSQPVQDPEWTGFKGFVHGAAKQHFDGRFSGNKAYLCEPPPKIDAAVTCLMWGPLFERDIFMERFYSRRR
jgi:Na+-transporting NADH:ubiquinone oxidoreductase subunit NqrF